MLSLSKHLYCNTKIDYCCGSDASTSRRKLRRDVLILSSIALPLPIYFTCKKLTLTT